jgi:hypothetical protein
VVDRSWFVRLHSIWGNLESQSASQGGHNAERSTPLAGYTRGGVPCA